jgi:hypothetical protein
MDSYKDQEQISNFNTGITRKYQDSLQESAEILGFSTDVSWI